MKPEEVLLKMNLEEKIDLCCGADFWHSKAFEKYGIPAFTVSDGPHGIRYQPQKGDMLGIHASQTATCFPTAAATACSWSRELLGKIGAAITEEALEFGVDAVLGPGLNIKRSPLCGRNFEYISEDPYLAGQLGAAYVKEGQKNGVGVCPKHFAANSQEYKRFSSDDHVDERTLREIYLPAFEQAVKTGKPAMIMSAYNKINGTYCSDNRWLLTDVLRREWGFDGLVVTDWGGMHDRPAGFAAGCDWSMPGGGTRHLQAKALEAYRNGTLTEEEIDRCALRMIRFALSAAKIREKSEKFDRRAHHMLAREAAVQSAVLLKNDGILPLKVSHAALIGDMAKNPRYQGSGSSRIIPYRLDSLCDAAPEWSYTSGCDFYGDTTEKLLEEVRRAAKSAEVCVVAAGLPECCESEGFDRDSMQMPQGHIGMIEAAAEANPNTVVVLFCGSPVELPWLDKVKAVLYMGLPGQAGGGAVLDLLTGRATPGGKLADTWPLSASDAPCAGYYGKPHHDAQYREGIYVGYRYYETAGVPVRFPFGFGLSYTAFDYSDLQIHGKTVTVSVKNTGAVSGAEVAQLYIVPPKAGIHRPLKELKGFERLVLKPGETKKAVFTLDDRSFAVWNDGWKIPQGLYEIQIGASARDIRLTAGFYAEGQTSFKPDRQVGSWYEKPAGYPPKADFEKLLGHPVPELKPPRKGSFTDENTILEMAEHSLILRIVNYFVVKTVKKLNGGKVDERDPAFRMTLSSSADCALYSMIISSCGSMPENIGYGLLEMANGHLLRGIKRMLKKR